MKKALWTVGVLLGLFLIARAISWPFTVDPGNPASYAADWGGPSLTGVAAVHCGPGVVSALVLIGVIIRGRLTARTTRDAEVIHPTTRRLDR